MQKEFKKADLKDGMVLHAEDGAKTTLVSDFYTTKEDLKIADGRIFGKVSGLEIIKIEYGGQVIWEKPTKRMTVDEMKAKLEELTGEKIEVKQEVDYDEMLSELQAYCDKQEDCLYCQFGDCCPISDVHVGNENLVKKCYKKVMKNGE